MGCKGSKTAGATKSEEKQVVGTLLEQPVAEVKSDKANDTAAAQVSAKEEGVETAPADAPISVGEPAVDTPDVMSASKETSADAGAPDSSTCMPSAKADDVVGDAMAPQSGGSKEEAEAEFDSVAASAPASAPQEQEAQTVGEGKTALAEAAATDPEASGAENAVDAAVDPEVDLGTVNKTAAVSQLWFLQYCCTASSTESQAEIIAEK